MILKRYSSIAVALLMATTAHADFDPSSDTNWNYLQESYTDLGGILEENKVTQPPFTLDETLLETLFASLPEREKIDIIHPEYFPSPEPEIVVTGDNVEVFTTFYSEGAGYKNTLGFYAYDGDTNRTKPTTRGELKTNGTLIFPNASKPNSGGDLEYGTTVSLGTFNKDTKILFFLVSNGWKNTNVRNSTWWTFSNDSSLNEEGEVEAKSGSDIPANRHVALLWKGSEDANGNAGRILLMGFEDILRTSNSCDHDFNDALFSVASNPITAISDTITEDENQTGGFATVPTEGDRDEDGILDAFDHYPDDAERAHDSYYPSETDTATLAYEDLWPFEGDYDMNDVSISFNIKEVQDKDNNVKEIVFRGNAESYGAGYYDGFSIALDTPAENIESATMTIEGFSSDEYNATVEADEDGNAVITLLSNTAQFNSKVKNLFTVGYDIVEDNKTADPDNIFWNVFNGREYVDENGNEYQTYVKSDTFTLDVVLKEATTLMAPPYNPFITVAGYLKETSFSEYKDDRREVHLPNFMPTTAHNDTGWFDLFGTEDDNTDLDSNRTYLTPDNKPWALLIPTKFANPVETFNIYDTATFDTYRHFNDWVDSNGTEYLDWYIYTNIDADGTLYANPNTIIIRD